MVLFRQQIDESVRVQERREDITAELKKAKQKTKKKVGNLVIVLQCTTVVLWAHQFEYLCLPVFLIFQVKDAEERSLQEAEAGADGESVVAAPHTETPVDKVTTEELKIDTQQMRSPREMATPRDDTISKFMWQTGQQFIL